ncbi:aspartate-semialdehyde dehydrogenase [Anaerosalibacter bizertensis]|uniref:Aspartate-semialdehyde dehydrogenase n=1 Tax=Anaerosalibacter bizertensis TaxID=932217 RepID=A0A9Q4FLN3_9FIRM|nr:aspartate-semialdehyde dehydrogenase [Anaerosalibacter bizertensis]HHV25622.1 aspartate-semialdehyde dehydrogenase [Tissierellia bacterium]MCB5560443.1 aspartate-semialdehyde dehydrogenase [Anaerosalibacter bizertensis]MCG4565956.1 aspartate-semialdehyde dehydrogenase [Anaerosalibacter bizertensis]MCG4583354.1 aspartate-semialdehyde dehydrogenase [Anaerosalibacter bizertensis]MCG4584962.1 aspartate-semialdehyde dehydrogenase [Anaerosalibacter bizertensis]
MKKINVGIVGATGMVGRNFLKLMEERNFPVKNLYLFASSKSSGKKILFREKEYEVEELTKNSFNKTIDLLLFSAGGEISKKFAPIAKEHGITVIDNSSAWRMDEDVPLIVPEVNPEDIKWHKGIIANPNCSTIQSVVPLKPLHENFKIKRIIFSTYQAVSGSGVAGMNDLENGLEYLKPKNYPHPIAFNCLPHIDSFMNNGYTKEEIKMIEETKKILHDDKLKITSTAVRVPVYFGHCVSANIEFENSFDIEEIYDVLNNYNGIVVLDDVEKDTYPMPINVEGKDEVYVGRIRRDFSVENGINIWIVADNTRKGAATNTVQIAELLLKNK